MADEAQQLDYLEKINTENAALEAEITRLTEAKLAETKQIAPAGTIKAPRAPGTGICVLDFGSLDHAESAGIGRGSSPKPPQCSRRTGTGGFFTS